ncbi:MAG: hypothetical protein ACK553_10645 [Planctomycetota bacterium]|jgi:hypothetical protein
MTCFRSSFDLRSSRCRFALAWLAIGLLGAIGCRQRAYNELYVENMASEIRLLEDRVYEYDAEYRALENELHDLKVINEGLESKLRDAEQQRIDARSLPKSNASRSLGPDATSPKPAVPKSTAPPSATPKPAAPKESLKLPSSEEIQLDVQTPEPPPLKKPTAPDTEELLPQKSDTKLIEPVAPVTPSPSLLPEKSILPGGASAAPRGLPSAVKPASFEERRIAAPTLPTERTTPSGPAKEPEGPRDTNVREIDFHPGLCRGLNTDGQAGEEGVALVLVPRNTQRDFVPATGKITVVMEETGETGVRRLGAWEYSPQEVAELIEPVGSGQGIHLQLLWKDVVPETQVIDLYVRFTDEQGITMKNHRQIHLRKSMPGQSTWTPR